MTNADLFRRIFGLYAEEFWSLPTDKMTAWLVADAPTAEPEIIRCKDCKHNQGSCCDYSAVYIRPNGYCQWAERKE